MATLMLAVSLLPAGVSFARPAAADAAVSSPVDVHVGHRDETPSGPGATGAGGGHAASCDLGADLYCLHCPAGVAGSCSTAIAATDSALAAAMADRFARSDPVERRLSPSLSSVFRPPRA